MFTYFSTSALRGILKTVSQTVSVSLPERKLPAKSIGRISVWECVPVERERASVIDDHFALDTFGQMPKARNERASLNHSGLLNHAVNISPFYWLF